ncbi:MULTISPECIES: FecR family protein [Reichenbachiella]|uniref:FecR family protein n=1 Tax=Reichenbachiella TaxID=156993 RepID=UPI000E6D1D76|nr:MULTISPECIES: FecR family protein [Reichenbachiella]MBU2914558.1 FecR domain-containing protein [Reichenbachiella agariperforans]RJE70607.1 hypothetical protein BGP76_11010 [Reichenbachiella sp. MSK19-1]
MKQGSHILEVLIDKFFKKRTTVKEEKLLDDFSEAYRTEEAWDNAVLGDKDELSNRMFETISNQIEHEEPKVIQHYALQWGMSIAASIVLLIGVFLWLDSHEVESQTMMFASGKQMDSVRLVDGTMIYLGAHSALSCAPDFNSKTRQVTLIRGNAFFDVARNPQKPFVISSGQIKTTVLGTSFNIDLKEDNCTVTVHTGKVNVKSQDQSVDLIPNQEAYFTGATSSLSKKTLTNSHMTRWYRRDLQLENTSLGEVLSVIEYKFGVKAQVKNQEDLKTPVTVFISHDATLSSVIEQLNYITGNLKIEMYEEIITVK